MRIELVKKRRPWSTCTKSSGATPSVTVAASATGSALSKSREQTRARRRVLAAPREAPVQGEQRAAEHEVHRQHVQQEGELQQRAQTSSVGAGCGSRSGSGTSGVIGPPPSLAGMPPRYAASARRSRPVPANGGISCRTSRQPADQVVELAGRRPLQPRERSATARLGAVAGGAVLLEGGGAAGTAPAGASRPAEGRRPAARDAPRARAARPGCPAKGGMRRPRQVATRTAGSHQEPAEPSGATGFAVAESTASSAATLRPRDELADAEVPAPRCGRSAHSTRKIARPPRPRPPRAPRRRQGVERRIAGPERRGRAGPGQRPRARRAVEGVEREGVAPPRGGRRLDPHAVHEHVALDHPGLAQPLAHPLAPAQRDEAEEHQDGGLEPREAPRPQRREAERGGD